MRGLLRCAAAGALLLAAAEGAAAQPMYWPRGSRLDVGLYAGGSVTTDWFRSRSLTPNGAPNPMVNGDEQGYGPGFGPAFGALANLWLTPRLGVRLHGAYVPMQLPTPVGAFDFAEGRTAYEVNSYFYDAGLTLRPFITRDVDAPLASVYLFAGGGGMTVDLAAEDREQCQRPYLLSLGACLSHQPSQATVGQGTAGAGADFPLAENFALFAEAAVHVYDSPVHVGAEWVGPVTAPPGTIMRLAEDAVAFTPRLVIGLKGRFGELLPPPGPPPPPQPLPPTAPPPPPPPPPRPPVTAREIRVCVVQHGMATEVTARFDPATGDTTFGAPGLPVPAGNEYAAGEPWFIQEEPIVVNGVQYALPRVLGVNDVVRVGEYRGIPVFAAAGTADPPLVVYVPVRPGCEFQPYQTDAKTGAVRGG